MNLTRVARTTSAAVVAGVAAIASYSHMRQLAAEHGQPPILSNLLPISVDGMLIVASAVLADDRAAGRPGRMSARVSFLTGVVASIVANVLAAPDNLVARVISAWPALALLLVVEMLTGGQPAPAVPSTKKEVEETPVRAAQGGGPDTAPQSSQPRSVPRKATPGKTPPAGNGARPSAAERVLAARAADPGASVADIARQAGVTDRTARRHLNGTPVG
ncbi:DUF2637 domain-containing protein [Micromonospora sp. LZ34]